MAPSDPPTTSTSIRHHRQPASGTPSQTQTEIGAPPHRRITIPAGTLRLRAVAAPSEARVQWAEDVVDNEGLGRKRSKGIYLRQIALDHSKVSIANKAILFYNLYS